MCVCRLFFRIHIGTFGLFSFWLTDSKRQTFKNGSSFNLLDLDLFCYGFGLIELGKYYFGLGLCVCRGVTTETRLSHSGCVDL